jgi:hypothetical protein
MNLQPRRLDFRNFDEALAEVERLHRDGYRQAGRWDLAQICDHLAYFIQGSLEGFTFRAPWLIRKLLGPFLLRRILKTRRMGEGWQTPQKPLPQPGGEETAAVERFRQLVERFRAHRGELQPSPLFGPLTSDEWRELHLIHCAHHLRFLVPKEQPPAP